MNQEKITKGIVLRAIDWREKDKILTIYSLDYGKISVKLRGARNPKSNLKFATFPLSYAEFTLTGKDEILLCNSASEVASFFAISSEYDRFSYASAVLEILDSITIDNVRDNRLFYITINALFCMCDFSLPIELIFSKFLISIFSTMGILFNLKSCQVCKNNFANGARLNLDTGEVVCLSCSATQYSILINPVVLAEIKLLSAFTFQDLGKLKLNNLDKILHILSKNLKFRLGKTLKSINLDKK